MACCFNMCGSIAEQDDIMTKPLRDRKTTDKFCLFLMIFFAFITLGISIFGFINGEPQRYVRGYDSYGNICGLQNDLKQDLPLSGKDLTNRRYVFWMNPSNFTFSPHICVEACPDVDLENPQDLLGFYRRTNISLCRYDIDIESYSRETSSSAPTRKFSDRGWGLCPKLPIARMKPVLNRCVPTYLIRSAQTIFLNFFALIHSSDLVKQFVAGLIVGRSAILIMVSSSLLFSYAIVFLLHYFASFVAYLIIWIFFCSVCALSGLLWYGYLALKFNWSKLPYNLGDEDQAYSEKTLLITACIVTAVAGIFLLAICSMRNSVKLVVALFYETASCFRAMPCLLCTPIRTIMAQAVFLTFWLTTLIFLVSCEELRKKNFMNDLAITSESQIESKTLGPSSYYTWVRFSLNPMINVLVVYLIVLLFWGTEFIIGCERAVVSGAVAAWYFTRDRSRLSNPLSTAFQIIFRKHLGSIGFGSFLMILFTIPRVIFKLITEKLKEKIDQAWAKKLLDCINCCCARIEECLRFVTYNAYTMMTIQGTNFCESGHNAVGIIVANSVKVMTINTVGDFILFLAKCSVASLCAFIGIILLRNEDLEFFSAPIGVGFLLSYIVASSVLSVYEMIIDSLFLCFCHDKNINDGSPGREYYAPLSLMSLLGKEDEANIPLQRQKDGKQKEGPDNPD